jgi:glycosyltransferase involved in cell wall biosynthesis
MTGFCHKRLSSPNQQVVCDAAAGAGVAGGFDVEIVVHDDASPDGSALHLREKHPDVKLIASAENAGFCVASNRMAAACGD